MSISSLNSSLAQGNSTDYTATDVIIGKLTCSYTCSCTDAGTTKQRFFCLCLVSRSTWFLYLRSTFCIHLSCWFLFPRCFVVLCSLGHLSRFVPSIVGSLFVADAGGDDDAVAAFDDLKPIYCRLRRQPCST